MAPKSSDRRDKVWNQLCSKPSQLQIKSIEVLDSNVFAPQTIHLDRATLLIGSHGTGKTLLLRIIEHCFGEWAGSDGPPYVDNGVRWRDDQDSIAGVFNVVLERGEVQLTHRVELSETVDVRKGKWTPLTGDNWDGPYFASATSMLYDLRIYFQDYAPPLADELTNSIRESSTDLNGLRGVTGRSYSKLITSTISTDSSGGYEVPYFDVTSSGWSYDNSMMSLGELWATYLLCWVADRSFGDPLLLDEPEAFIAARAHRPLVDELARRVLRSNSQLIAATHSPSIVQRFPLPNIRLCARTSQGIRVSTPQSLTQVYDSIGIKIPANSVVFVEDSFAREVLGEMCQQLDPYLLRAAEIVAAGGESRALAAHDVLGLAEKINSAVVLDGDMRSRQQGGRNILFLPGKSDPEAELISAANRDTELLSKYINRSRDEVAAAIDTTIDLDHQYWISSVARYLAISEGSLKMALVAVWLKDPQVNEAARTLLNSIRATID